MQVVLALPAYNEERGLPCLLEAFQRASSAGGYSARLVIVDDGSTDGTSDLIRAWSSKLPTRTMRHPVNRGLGETIKDALQLAARECQPDDIIVTMDADNTHPPELIGEMIALILEGHDVAIASRYRPGARVVGLSAFRHLASYGALILFRVLFPIPGVRDYTSGFRAYRAAILQNAFATRGAHLITEPGFAAMAELLLNLHRLGARMCEAPLVLRYDLKGGASKMNVTRTVLRTLRLLVRLRFAGAGTARS